MQTQVQKEWIENAIERAKLFGMLNYMPGGELTHIPFCLSPFKISKSELKEMIELTSYFSKLMIDVSHNWEFIEEHLRPIAKNDSFLKMLLDLKIDEVTQNKQILIQRNDFFLMNNEQRKKSPITYEDNNDLPRSLIKQVEINTISASFPFLITQLCRLHQNFSEQKRFEAVVGNNPINYIVESFAEAHKAYGTNDGIILLVAQPKEKNLFDQIGLEQLLWQKYRIKTARKSLSEIFENCFLRNGHLILDGKIVTITYYRSGYSPNDFTEKISIRGRKLIESSSTIQVPTLSSQLAGMKKIQQVLTKPKILSKFVTPGVSKIILKTFVKMHSLDEILETSRGKVNASAWASQNHQHYVLKPQREGGGNNFFGNDIMNLISQIPKKELNAYVLMEKIIPKNHPAILVVNNKSEELSCISEIGRYGICNAENGVVKSNKDVGYLVRTKSENINEGGVCAGFACLNSLKTL